MSLSGVVCPQHTPDLTGKDAEKGEHKGDGDRETQAAEGESEGGTADATDAADATGESGKA